MLARLAAALAALAALALLAPPLAGAWQNRWLDDQRTSMIAGASPGSVLVASTAPEPTIEEWDGIAMEIACAAAAHPAVRAGSARLRWPLVIKLYKLTDDEMEAGPMILVMQQGPQPFAVVSVKACSTRL